MITLLPCDEGSERLILVAGTLLAASPFGFAFCTSDSELVLVLSVITSAFLTKREDVNRSVTETFVATIALEEFTVSLAPLTAVSLGAGLEALARVPGGLLPRRTTLFVDFALLVVAFVDLEPVDLDFKASPLH